LLPLPLLLPLLLLLLQLPRIGTENGYRVGHRPARPSILVIGKRDETLL
jgi:hypothetical protein